MNQITCQHCGDTYPGFDVAHVCLKGYYAPKFPPAMNEKIKELMKQAGYAAPEMALRAQKLVRLVVQECLTLVDNEDDYVKVIEHFGLENE